MEFNHFKDFRNGAFSAALVVVVMSFTRAAVAQDFGSSGALGDVSKANTRFSGDFYKALREGNPGNLVCSPLSVSAVIAMLKGGARGETANQIQSTFRFPKDGILFSGYQSLLRSLKSNENFTLEIANRVYAKTGFDLNPNYVKIVTQYFGAELEQVDFTKSTETANKINGWVEGITQKRITNLISPGDLDDLTRLVLVNGIYFKGKWKAQFDATKTQDAPFYVPNSSPVTVRMMEIETDLPYAEIQELDAKAVSLSYLGDRLSMIVLLPNAKDGLSRMEEALKTFDLSSLPSLFRTRSVNLKMPKFQLESTLDLRTPLSNLGSSSMFDQGSADFSGIPKNPLQDRLYVSKAVQKAFIEVNEEGSEAAAATGILIRLKRSLTAASAIEFHVDHPFVSLIVSRTLPQEGIDTLFMFSLAKPHPEPKHPLRVEL